MIKKLSLLAAVVTILLGSFINASAHADNYYRSDFERRHCRDYGGVFTAEGGCYISSKAQRKRLIVDEQAWNEAQMHHHRHYEDYSVNPYYHY